MRQRCNAILLALTVTLLAACATGGREDFHLNIAHLNDTHSHLAPTPVELTIGGVKTTAQLGGFARLQTLVDEMRGADGHFLLLHAGDAVQGTLYFTLFNGIAEFNFLNRLGVDAMTFGNHEFDRGPAAIPAYLERAQFPLLGGNVDFAEEPAIAPKVSQALVREIAGERVGIFGLTTETTPQTTIDVGAVKFRDPLESARRQVAALERLGVNKIIALSHLGYAADLRLAAAVNGIDLIVGGHSHSLLGEGAQLALLGLTPEGKYPTEVTTPDGGKTLVVQAWQWGHELGQLRLAFDRAGRVVDTTAAPIIPLGPEFSRNGVPVPPDSPAYREIRQALASSGLARIVAEEPATAAALAPYTAQIETFRRQTIAIADQNLVRGLNQGPGPLVADSMLLALPGAQVAILNYGGVRKDLLAGTISVGDVLELLPFNNSLVLVELTGAELLAALEEDIAFLLTKYGAQQPLALPYVAGIRFTVAPAAAKGERIKALAIKSGDGSYQPLDQRSSYRTVVNAFVANGGDGFTPLRTALGFRSDTGIIDSDAFREYLRAKGRVENSTEQRVTVQ